jgi:hypothetical protein
MSSRVFVERKIYAMLGTALSAILLSGTILAPHAADAASLPGSFKGGAYGVQLLGTVGPVDVQAERIGNRTMSCRSLDGKVLSTSSDAVSVGDGNVLTAAAVRSTATSDKTASIATAQTTSTITGASLLGGLITADAINAVANERATAADLATSTAGSGFTNLRIAGKGVSVHANQKIDLPSVGTVTLERIVKSDKAGNQGKISVDMLALDVTKANGFGLPVGVTLVLGHATTGYTPLELDAGVRGSAFASQGIVTGPGVGDQSRTGVIGLGCEGTDGKTVIKNTAAVSVDKVLSLGTAVTTSLGGPKGAGIIARTSAQVNGINFLSGLVTTGTIVAVAQDIVTGGKRASSTGGSVVKGLRIAGLPLGDVTKPNRRLALPGIGYIVVNEQNDTPTGQESTFANGLHIHVTLANGRGLPIGSDIIIAHADSFAKP